MGAYNKEWAKSVYENTGYDLILMDAFGATLYLQLKDLSNVSFV